MSKKKSSRPTSQADTTRLQELQRDEISLLEKEIRRREELPHLYGQKMYKWQREFFESRNEQLFLTAANQLGKSSVLIRKNIHWATDQSLWKSLWRTRPKVFFYLYPSYDVATREFHTKWEPEFLPRGSMRTDPIYGWHPEFDKKQLKIIKFNSGVDLYFMAYAQSSMVMQATTAHCVSGDEELPEELYTELRFRLMATSGYFACAFTATLGQEFWRLVMEEKGAQELFPQAHKMQVSLYDSMFFEDGTPSHWTPEKIKQAIAACPNEAEVQRRVFGRFVKPEGKRYGTFARGKHVRENPASPPPDWLIYCGVDLGSGANMGTTAKGSLSSHAAAITFVAIRPDFKEGRVFKHWNGKGLLTSASDVFNKFMEMRGSLRCVSQSYDYSGKDFGIISGRAGEGFIRANKDREFGDNIINSLFRNNMLTIDDKAECIPLIRELENLRVDTSKTIAIDDSVDSLRYTVTLAPWDWSFLNPEAALVDLSGNPLSSDKPGISSEEKERRAISIGGDEEFLGGNASLDSEFDFWQDYLDA